MLIEGGRGQDGASDGASRELTVVAAATLREVTRIAEFAVRHPLCGRPGKAQEAARHVQVSLEKGEEGIAPSVSPLRV